jgi:uracil-DNA glycosylase
VLFGQVVGPRRFLFQGLFLGLPSPSFEVTGVTSLKSDPTSRYPMKSDSERKFMLRVLACKKCRNDDRTRDLIPESVYPVYSFGNPLDPRKQVVIVGLNPSRKEYGKYLSQDENPEKRLDRQLNYFQGNRSPHPYFRKLNRYFSREAKRVLQCDKYIWEKALFLDLVKCATSPPWSRLKPIRREAMIGNCEDYLMRQIKLYRPEFFISCGQDTTRWFQRNKHRIPSDMPIIQLKTRFQKTQDLRRQKRRLEREIVKWKKMK